MKLGLDTLGGDFAPESNVLGAIHAVKELPKEVRIVLIGNEQENKAILEREGVSSSLFDFIHTDVNIGMSEHPTKAFAKKQDSSIALGFHLLKEGKINSFSSTGNTGAMLVGSMLTVKAIPGVIRPCITSAIPQEDGSVSIILDVGTNADCKPDVLYQFGILGSHFVKHIYNIENPKVALLNIGEEKEKGNLLTQATHELMSETTDFNFIGNIEGRDLFNSSADVVVCDGFTGNVVLKEAEAFYVVAKKRGIKDEFFDRFNYEIYGGSPVLGINSNVIIGHGISSPVAIKNMLFLAKDVAEAELSKKIQKAFL
ncbi:MAG: phosphate--acyl-ACP acyltransferase [Crocinitomicaceae bacterium]|nr:phosphate--acyl-ACP acyltransferase [Crocinitomicaceae bacterium]|tara:strand:- start:4302 stop:5240 length:939 start_codon:yes stop_codon:yes gene_type:complete